MTFASSSAGKWPSPREWLNKCVNAQGLLGRFQNHLLGMPSKPQAFHNFKDCISFGTSQGWILTEGGVGGCSSTAACRASTSAPTCRLWSQSHKSCALNWFSKQSTIMLALSIEYYTEVRGQWIAEAFGPLLFQRDFAIGHTAWSVTLQSVNSVSPLSSAHFQTIPLILQVTQFTAVLHDESMISCHYFLKLLLFINKQPFYNCSFSSW
jgi:hypothetical protein